MHWQDTAGGPSKAPAWKHHTCTKAGDGEGNHKEVAEIIKCKSLTDKATSVRTQHLPDKRQQMTRLQDRTGLPWWVRVHLAPRGEVIDGTVASASRDN